MQEIELNRRNKEEVKTYWDGFERAVNFIEDKMSKGDNNLLAVLYHARMMVKIARENEE